MSKPVIGIVTTVGPDPGTDEDRDIYYVGKPYVDCVQAAGGVALLIPHNSQAQDLIDILDGWLIIGGKDIEPEFYGQSPHAKADLEATQRFELEREIYVQAPDNMPVLGICYGCQFLNLMRDGTLQQHIPDLIGNDDHSGGTDQRYAVTGGSLLSTIVGDEPVSGKSYHHQAVDEVGHNLAVVAKADDGTIEAIEDTKGRWIVGIQWHPERSPDNPASRALFTEFVAQASRYQKEKEACGTW